MVTGTKRNCGECHQKSRFGFCKKCRCFIKAKILVEDELCELQRWPEQSLLNYSRQIRICQLCEWFNLRDGFCLVSGVNVIMQLKIYSHRGKTCNICPLIFGDFAGIYKALRTNNSPVFSEKSKKLKIFSFFIFFTFFEEFSIFPSI